MIRINNLNKYYNKGKSNEIHVIDNANLELPNCGLITFLGESGSGKTTLLNVIGGLDKAKGTIEYDDIKFDKYQMSKIDKYRQEHIGYVFQNYNLINDISVYENLRIALDAIDIIDKEEVDKRIEYALKAVGLYKYKKKQANNLSGGQMQRVSIARALIKNSKIIIADEPTGNLDSENTIEIMNILKKISEKSLVLLVTHNKNIAEFYSDEIIEIKDGKIANVRKTKNDVFLKNDSNKIYLKDLNVVEGNDDNFQYKIYSNDKIDKFDFIIIEQNNQIYLKANKKIKLIEDTNFQLINDYKKEINKENINFSFAYDTSWYNEKKERSFFKRTKKEIKFAFKNYFQTRKLSKLFHAVFVLIGVVLAFFNMTYATYTNVNTKDISFDNDVYGVREARKYGSMNNSNFDINNYINVIKEAINENAIDNLYSRAENNYYLNIQYNSFLKQTISFNANAFDLSLINNYDFIAGKMSQNSNEIVIGKKLADNLLDQMDKNVSYNILLGKKVYQNATLEKYIVGIVDKDSCAVYYNDDSIINVCNNVIDESSILYTRNYGYKDYEQGYYEVVYGDDLSNEGNQVLINIDSLNLDSSQYKDYLDSNDKIFKDINDQNLQFKAVGLIKSKVNYVNLPSFIVNNKNVKYLMLDFNNRLLAYPNENISYEITEGENISSLLEGLVSCYSNINIGDTIGDVTIVGKYRLKSGFNNNYHNTFEETALISQKSIEFLKSSVGLTSSYNGVRYFSGDISKMESFFKKNGFNIDKIYNLTFDNNRESTKESRNELLPIISVLIVFVLVYTYFSMRSKMIKDIYNIGVNRELGFSRIKIIKKYAIDTFVLTLFTSLMGYIITTIIYGIFALKANEVGFSFANVFISNSTYILLILLIFLSVLIGMIPIITLLRKTPSEIVAKYDI